MSKFTHRADRPRVARSFNPDGPSRLLWSMLASPTVVLGVGVTGVAQSTPTARSAGPPAANATATAVSTTAATPPGPGAAVGASPSAADADPDADAAALRAEAAAQLQGLGSPAPTGSSAAAPTGAPVAPPSTPAAPASTSGPASGATTPRPAESPADRQLREVLQERLRLLDEYDKAAAALKKAAHPASSPEKQAADARGELVRIQALLAQALAHPDVVLPPSFRPASPGARLVVSAEMKDALDVASGECKEARAKLEALQAEVTGWEARQNARRTERDKQYQVVAALKARGTERNVPETAASTPAATAAAAPSAKPSAVSRRLARERQVNDNWKARVELIRLQAAEAEIALESKLAGVREVELQVAQAQVRLAERTLEVMQGRYSVAAEQQEEALKQKAAAEENRSRVANDPLERFRAGRVATLLELEAQVVKLERALATNPPPSLEEQRGLADHAAADFARIKDLLDDGRVSRLDAIRLNNDFRRIGPERDRLIRNEVAIVETRLQYYEDVLTEVELELIRDSVHDRYELELLREQLPPSRWAEGESVLNGLEQRHRALLIRRRAALEHLNEATAQTLEQVSRRLAILDEEYGFIRTHIFWVRDQEPIGLGTISQGARESRHVCRALWRLGHEASRVDQWGRRSPEFVGASIAALVLPFGLIRLRRALRALIARDLPAPTRPAS